MNLRTCLANASSRLIVSRLVLCILFSPASSLQAQSPTQGNQPSPAQKYFTDVELINQDGQTMRLYSDVLKGKVIVINPFFTTCTSVCPPMTHNLEALQDALGDALGKRVFIISITVDPITDTPEKLKAYAQKFHARAGRLFLTGKKENVEFALGKLGMYVADKNDHSTVLVIGNEPTGLWKKAFALAKTDEIVKIVQSVMQDK